MIPQREAEVPQVPSLGTRVTEMEVALLPAGGGGGVLCSPTHPPGYPQRCGGRGEGWGGVWGGDMVLEVSWAVSTPWPQPCTGWCLYGGEGQSCGVWDLWGHSSYKSWGKMQWMLPCSGVGGGRRKGHRQTWLCRALWGPCGPPR